MALSEREKALLDKLQQKAEAPEPPAVGKHVNVTVDLGNREQVAMAQRYGFLPADLDEITEEEEGEGDGADEGDSKPNRKGFFE